MKCAEQVRNVYVRAQMWKAIYRYIIKAQSEWNQHILELMYDFLNNAE